MGWTLHSIPLLILELLIKLNNTKGWIIKWLVIIAIFRVCVKDQSHIEIWKCTLLKQQNQVQRLRAGCLFV